MEKELERTYKDRLFRMIFRKKECLLSLYNVVNGTDYKNPEDLEVNTLENAIYMNMKNDVSFVFDSYLNLYEHQSTYNPNMPLRNLFYIARLLEKLVKDSTLYSTSLTRIQTPRFVVFYNGTEEQPELELKVLMLNINPGKNDALLKRCRQLQDYMQYVSRVRNYARNMEIRDAVVQAVEECIREGILGEFLQKYRAEAIQVSIFEYDEEKEIKKIREAEYQEGVRQGIEQGIQALIKTCREFGAPKKEVRSRIMREFSLAEEKAESYVAKYW